MMCYVVLYRQLRKAGHEMFRGADVQQIDDTKRMCNGWLSRV